MRQYTLCKKETMMPNTEIIYMDKHTVTWRKNKEKVRRKFKCGNITVKSSSPLPSSWLDDPGCKQTKIHRQETEEKEQKTVYLYSLAIIHKSLI